MNFTAVGHSTDIIQTEGQRLDPKWSADRKQQYAALARLEEKYGGRKLRIDSAHRTPNPPHLRALQLKAYTDWLTQHVATPESFVEQNSTLQPLPAGPTTTADSERGLTGSSSRPAYAAPDILARPIWNVTDATSAPPRPAARRTPVSTPVDDSGLSSEQLRRIDLAHATTGSARSRQMPTGSSSKPGKDLPTTTVAWEVNDFIWPGALNHSNLLTSETAQAMVDAVVSSLSATEQRLAVVGSGRGKGTTTISMYVAKIMAARGNKVLLVDADLAKPDLTSRFGLPANLSWMNVIDENQKCSDAIVRSIETGVCVMPVSKLGARVAWPDNIFNCLAVILDQVRQDFDLVIIDFGPSSQLIRELSRPELLVDAALLVHNVRFPDSSVFVHNQNELNSFGIKKLVVAENFAAGKAA